MNKMAVKKNQVLKYFSIFKKSKQIKFLVAVKIKCCVKMLENSCILEQTKFVPLFKIYGTDI